MIGRWTVRFSMLLSALCLGVALTLAPPPVRAADDEPVYGPRLEGFAYPWPVAHHSFTSQGEAMEMAYMDVPPASSKGRTAVLLHGKNFCAVTWEDTIRILAGAGYRVIAPDQIGFCNRQNRHTTNTPSRNSPETPVRCSPRSASHARRLSATRLAACSACATP